MNEDLLQKITSLAKRRGFIYPSSEIYGGFSAIYDYGHYGILLKNNIQNLWWRDMVFEREDVYGLDSAIFMHPKTWEASGHTTGFDDPQMDCRNCKNRMRVDHFLEKFGLNVDRWSIEDVNKELDKLRMEKKLKCDKCGSDDITEAKRFNLLVRSNLGSPTEKLSDDNVTYLRGETCQGIYLEYKNIIQSVATKLPFGIAQVGKAFRNEIVARQFVFRTREFEQMEMQYFLHPSIMNEKYNYWMAERKKWYVEKLGIREENLKFKEHEKLVFYASRAFDIQYNFRSLGKFDEVEGIHARGNYDLSQHQKFSGKNMEYFDQEKNEKYIPNIIETSVGLNRLVFAVLDQAYTQEEINGETRIVLKLNPKIAPVKFAVFPLIKDEKLIKLAREIFEKLKKSGEMIEYDESGSIGKRYRKQDEIGTPNCITVDFESLEDGCVTIRDRDTLKQERVKIESL